MPFLTLKDGKPLGLYSEVSREVFEKLIENMVESTLVQVDTELHDAGLKEDDIGTILLIGGSTRIPLVQRTIEKKFGSEPKHEIRPDKAVALGAAIQAGLKSGELSAENDILITDVFPYTLGTDVVDYEFGIPVKGIFDILIKRNTTIPVSVKKNYTTLMPPQKTWKTSKLI